MEKHVDCEEEILFPATGVNAVDGSYARPALSAQAVAVLARQSGGDHRHWGEVAAGVARSRAGTREPVDEYSPVSLAEAGWGIIFSEHADPAIREALGDLCDLRKKEAGGSYAEFSGKTGLRANETKLDFLRSVRVAPGAADPRRLPYYLLLVGGPEEIPFRFQYQLGVRHAVGRLDLEKPEHYYHYAKSVLSAQERAPSTRSRDLTLFAPANKGDELTGLSSEILAGEVRHQMLQSAAASSWTVQSFRGDDASKSRLKAILSGSSRPDVLLSATHGVTFDYGHPNRRSRQGALLCQDWPGPSHRGPTPSDWYFAAEDIDDDTDLTGMVVFNFACYSAGTHVGQTPFTAALAQRMLSLPRGGAAAVVGHVDTTWWHSFLWAGLQWPQAYEQSLKRLLRGDPLGWSMEPFRRRYAELTSDLYDVLRYDELGLAASTDTQQLAELWTATLDARGFVVLGDPAVRLSRLEGAS